MKYLILRNLTSDNVILDNLSFFLLARYYQTMSMFFIQENIKLVLVVKIKVGS